jgi:hypothetical protein
MKRPYVAAASSFVFTPDQQQDNGVIPTFVSPAATSWDQFSDLVGSTALSARMDPILPLVDNSPP